MGASALEALAEHDYDVLLLDIQMPEVDGLEVARRILAEQPDPAERPWIIAVTANAIVGDREACLAAGMDDFIPKPMKLATLEAALARAMAERPRGPGGRRRGVSSRDCALPRRRAGARTEPRAGEQHACEGLARVLDDPQLSVAVHARDVAGLGRFRFRQRHRRAVRPRDVGLVVLEGDAQGIGTASERHPDRHDVARPVPLPRRRVGRAVTAGAGVPGGRMAGANVISTGSCR